MFGDQFKIEQVVVNFVNNAIKYAPDSEEIMLYVDQDDDAVTVSVVDKGHGIPAAEQPRIFDRYYRIVGQPNKPDSGLGLGLYICAEIIRRHGGKIGVNSIIGEGSSF
ncbi:MAG: sensor histidine kinase [Pedobacter sp.]